jgi:hypothetical protein
MNMLQYITDSITYVVLCYITLHDNTGASGYACAALYCLQRGEVLHRPLAKVNDALSAFTQGLAYDKQASTCVYSICMINIHSISSMKPSKR